MKTRIKLRKKRLLLIIGVDPGMGGALSFFWNEDPQGSDCTVVDMPTVAKLSGKGNLVNAYALSHIIEERTSDCLSQAYIEQVHSMPRDGTTAAFSFGRSCGVLDGVFAAHRVPIVMITPQKWKRRAGLIKKEKDVSRLLAMQLFPNMSEQLSRKKDIGRADALLIAHFGMQA